MDRSYQILVTVPFRPHHMERIREAAGPAAKVRQISAPATLEDLADVEVVIGEPAPAILAQAPDVRWVQMTWAGTDLYTRGEIAFPKDKCLTNVAGTAYGHIISQYVVGQILSIAQNLPTYVRQQEHETWKCAGSVKSLEDAHVLIFGAGDLGTLTAKRLSSFDAHCTGVCRSTDRPRPFFDRLVALDEAEALLPDSDVVVNCLPNTDQTRRWLDERRLRLMKEDAIFVNVGRGNFCDCMALAQVLAEGLIRGAALDVTDPEPLPVGHPLWSEPRCVITPHEAGGAFGKNLGTEDRICDVCCENLRRYVAGEPLTRVVC